MKTVQELYFFIGRNQGKTIRYGEYSIQVYSGTTQAAIFHQTSAILKIEAKVDSNNTLSFYLPNESDPNSINYVKSSTLEFNDPIVKLYTSFSQHKSIEDVLVALLQLKEGN